MAVRRKSLKTQTRKFGSFTLNDLKLLTSPILSGAAPHFLRPAANDDFLIEATVKRFGKASAYIDCSVTFAGSGELVAHAVLEFAY